MSDIQRHDLADGMDLISMVIWNNGSWVKYKDYIKAMKAKDESLDLASKLITNLREKVEAQAKEIECLNIINDNVQNELDMVASEADKTILEQAKEIEENKTYTSGLEGIIKEQTKEIEQLKDKLFKVGSAWGEIKIENNKLISYVKELTK